MRVAIILGTRPEIIKLSPVIRECVKQGLEYFIIHTNQHYSSGMDKVFFQELQLPQPKYNLDTHDSSHGAMVGRMLIGLEPILETELPDWVLVQGDTNTVLAGALAASKLGIKVGHIEAGLRSYDRTMPEEINRVVADHVSSALFCPTDNSVSIAIGEGISKDIVFQTGNTIVDAINQNLDIAKSSPYAKKYISENYILLTMHRPSNVDDKSSLSQIILSLEALVDELAIPIIFPIHPRTQAALKKFSINPDPSKIKIIDPVGYLEMLTLMCYAKLIVTDSGGVQEEACILHVPCITIRDNTERPETVEVGANMLVGSAKDKVISGAKTMISKSRNWSNPFGTNDLSKNIIDIILHGKEV